MNCIPDSINTLERGIRVRTREIDIMKRQLDVEKELYFTELCELTEKTYHLRIKCHDVEEQHRKEYSYTGPIPIVLKDVCIAVVHDEYIRSLQLDEVMYTPDDGPIDILCRRIRKFLDGDDVMFVHVLDNDQRVDREVEERKAHRERMIEEDNAERSRIQYEKRQRIMQLHDHYEQLSGLSKENVRVKFVYKFSPRDFPERVSTKESFLVCRVPVGILGSTRVTVSTGNGRCEIELQRDGGTNIISSDDAPVFILANSIRDMRMNECSHVDTASDMEIVYRENAIL